LLDLQQLEPGVWPFCPDDMPLQLLHLNYFTRCLEIEPTSRFLSNSDTPDGILPALNTVQTCLALLFLDAITSSGPLTTSIAFSLEYPSEPTLGKSRVVVTRANLLEPALRVLFSYAPAV
jgi:hypothetical protein